MQRVVELTLDFFAGVAVTFFAGVDRTHTVGVGRQLRLALQPGLAPSSGVFYQRSLMTKRLQENEASHKRPTEGQSARKPPYQEG